MKLANTPTKDHPSIYPTSNLFSVATNLAYFSVIEKLNLERKCIYTYIVTGYSPVLHTGRGKTIQHDFIKTQKNAHNLIIQILRV